MPTSEQAPLCANCGLDIWWRPTVVDGRTYCCGGCAQGGPCYCSYDLPVSAPKTFAEEQAASNPQPGRGIYSAPTPQYQARESTRKEDPL
jgi:hypothetical protein